MSMFDSAVAEPHTDVCIDFKFWRKTEKNCSLTRGKENLTDETNAVSESDEVLRWDFRGAHAATGQPVNFSQ
ncbi:hypothetical protein N7449_001372 [Penicillium cf. viridicatum]|uniref:Uncharacterized protein n=1 Tax=Penicillium cf. viridicatum TaxID=2972119 RepID=A0A9W9T973_9EURO|nr:hypothetical protein N7449_001372 [Penicillium cf. viridicatum]